MNRETYPIHGSCQCGGVTYTLKAKPLAIAACHCRQCQKLSTSAFSITAIVQADSITFKGQMKDWSRKADNGNENAAKFCPSCGNRIYHVNPAEPDKLKLKLKPASLSDTGIIKPTMHIWVSEKQDWFDIPAGAVFFEKQPF